MKNIIVKQTSWLRSVFPAAQASRRFASKYSDRIAQRLVISGGRVPFMDAVLQFPEGVGVTYSTPLFWNGSEAYEPATSGVLTRLIDRSKVFLDIGSNIGIYAVYAGVKHPKVATFAFEPVAGIHAKNVDFHRANHLREENLFQLALSDDEKTQEFFLPVYTTGLEEEQTGTLNAASWQTSEARVEKISVRCTTLDHFTATHTLPEGRCCVKIDVENHEAAVLRGGRQFVKSRRPWIVCEILYGQKVDAATGGRVNDNLEVLGLIEELALTPFALTNDGLFRMNLTDFNRPRTFKDFLLAPAEQIPADVTYLDLGSLSDLLPAS